MAKPKQRPLDLIMLGMLVFLPVAIITHFMDVPATAKFITAALAIVPLAGYVGRATESLSVRVGAGLSSFLNASFGNAAELIIGIAALREGLPEVVKASISGAIIGNILLVLGFSFFVGGLKREKQQFNPTATSLGATLLLLSAIGLVIPALFHLVAAQSGVPEQELSLEIAVVLIIVYCLSLVFSLKTHKHLYLGQAREEEARPEWSPAWATGILLASTAVIAVVSEFMVTAIRPAAESWGMSELFIGVVLIALVGNAVEHFSAIPFALKDQMDLSLGIALGGSQQIALFVAPVLVFVSYLIGKPMNLLFNLFEVVGLLLAVIVVKFVATDGESNWMEGVLLISVYVILAIAFYFLP